MAIEGSVPAGTWLTRVVLILGGASIIGTASLVVSGQSHTAAWVASGSAILLLLGGHRANHGDGRPFDRMLDALLDRVWDGAVLGSIAWATRADLSSVTAGALVALGASFVSSYIRARGASLGYTVEESHVTRGIRYALVVYGLGVDQLRWTLWTAAAIAILAVVVRTTQVAKEERV